MSTLRVEGIKNAAASSDAITLAADGTCTAKITNNLSNRNLIINGAMQIAQRGTSSTGLGASAGYFTLDRYRTTFSSTAGRLTMAQVADVHDGFANAMKLTCTTADTSIASGEYFILQQKFEGQNLQQLKKGSSDAEEFTVSFYVKGNASATYVVEMYDLDNARQVSKTFSVTTNWTRVVLTFPADTTGALDDDNAASLQMGIWLHGGSNYTSGTLNTTWGSVTQANRAEGISSFFDSTNRTFFLTGLQMEVGSVATDFEHRSYGDELIRCQRYYENIKGPDLSTAGSNETLIGVGHAYTNNRVLGNWRYKVQKRAAPSITTDAANEIQALISGTGWVSAGTFGGNTNIYCTRMDVQSISGSPCTAGHCCEIRLTADGIIHFNSEL